MNSERFKEHLRPHDAKAIEALEKSIVSEGCISPLIVAVFEGGQFLVDGFHRKAICDRLGIGYEVKEIPFSCEQDVLSWMERNSRIRRNLTRTERLYYIGSRYNREKKDHGGDRKSKKSIRQVDGLIESAERIAKEEGVASRTVERAAKMAKHVDHVCVGKMAWLKWEILSERIKYGKKMLDMVEHVGPGGCEDEIRNLIANTDQGKSISAKAVLDCISVEGEEQGEERDPAEERESTYLRKESRIIEQIEALISEFGDKKHYIAIRLEALAGRIAGSSKKVKQHA